MLNVPSITHMSVWVISVYILVLPFHPDWQFSDSVYIYIYIYIYIYTVILYGTYMLNVSSIPHKSVWVISVYIGSPLSPRLAVFRFRIYIFIHIYTVILYGTYMLNVSSIPHKSVWVIYLSILVLPFNPQLAVCRFC